MNKRITFFVGLFLLTMSVLSDATPTREHKNLKDSTVFKKFCASYVGSALLGGTVGAATGSLIKYLEGEAQQYLSQKWNINELATVALILLGWAIESEVRNDVVLGLQGDLDENQISYKKMIMLRSAWIASWLSYLGM